MAIVAIKNFVSSAALCSSFPNPKRWEMESKDMLSWGNRGTLGSVVVREQLGFLNIGIVVKLYCVHGQRTESWMLVVGLRFHPTNETRYTLFDRYQVMF